jgi:hypothetical protein
MDKRCSLSLAHEIFDQARPRPIHFALTVCFHEKVTRRIIMPHPVLLRCNKDFDLLSILFNQEKAIQVAVVENVIFQFSEEEVIAYRKKQIWIEN